MPCDPGIPPNANANSVHPHYAIASAICLTFPNPAMKTQSSFRFAATFLKLPYSADSLFSKKPMRYRFLD